MAECWTGRVPLGAAVALTALAAALAACGGSDGSGAGGPAPPREAADPLFVGEWRVYSETLFYDAGGSAGADSGGSTTRRLSLNDDGTWEFGSSSGNWYAGSIDEADWTAWEIDPYGPQKKIVLEGWNGDVASGPVEESDGGVDFFWVIYRVEEPDAGVVQMKFGHP